MRTCRNLSFRIDGNANEGTAEPAFQPVIRALKTLGTDWGLSLSSTSSVAKARQIALVDCYEVEAAELRVQFGKSVIVEPLMRRWHPPVMGSPDQQRRQVQADGGTLATTAKLATLHVAVEGDGRRRPRVNVTLVLTPPKVFAETTDASGMCRFEYSIPDFNPQSLSTAADQGYSGQWRKSFERISSSSCTAAIEIRCFPGVVASGDGNSNIRLASWQWNSRRPNRHRRGTASLPNARHASGLAD